jgi:hypothetical protein
LEQRAAHLSLLVTLWPAADKRRTTPYQWGFDVELKTEQMPSSHQIAKDNRDLVSQSGRSSQSVIVEADAPALFLSLRIAQPVKP